MKLSSILSEKYIILTLHFQLFPNVTRKVGAFVGSCWPTYLKQRDTNLRKAIPAAEKLVLTMQFLASGDSQALFIYFIYSLFYVDIYRNILFTNKNSKNMVIDVNVLI